MSLFNSCWAAMILMCLTGIVNPNSSSGSELSESKTVKLILLRQTDTPTVELGKASPVVFVDGPASQIVASLSIEGVSALPIDSNHRVWSAAIPVALPSGPQTIAFTVECMLRDGKKVTKKFRWNVIIAPGRDQNGNGIPDELDFDANGDGIPDDAVTYSEVDRRIRDKRPRHLDQDGLDKRLKVMAGFEPEKRVGDVTLAKTQIRQAVQDYPALQSLFGRPDRVQLIKNATALAASRLKAEHDDPGFAVGSFEDISPSMADGTVRYTISIKAPAARGGMDPALSLNYSSGRGHGVAGQGWELHTPFIQRSTRFGVPKYTTEDVFEYHSPSGMQELAPTGVPGEYRAKIDEHFTTFLFTNNSWTAITKDGRRFSFGRSGESRSTGSVSGLDLTSTWYVDEATDLNGNRIVYGYLRDANAIYLDHVDYNDVQPLFPGPPPIPSTYRLSVFGAASESLVPIISGDDRLDQRVSYRYGYEIRVRKRIAAIQLSFNDPNGKQEVLRRYVLEYKQSDQGSRSSLLTSVQQVGRGLSKSLPLHTFGYYRNSGEWIPAPKMALPPGVSLRFDAQDNGTRFLDVNGDGYPDIVIAPRVGSGQVWLNDSHGGWTMASGPSGTLPPNMFLETDLYFTAYRSADFNADGLADFFYGREGEGQKFWLNTGNGWRDPRQLGWTVPTDLFFVDFYGRSKGTELADLNGDGLPDFIQKVPGSPVKVWLNNGKGWSAATSGGPWEFPNNVSIIAPDGRTNGVIFADLNGDGLDDMIVSHSGFKNQVWLNTGFGWTFSPEYTFNDSISFVGYDERDTGTRLIDVDGDGLPDILPPGTGSTRNVLLNTGSGWRPTTISLPPNTQFLIDYGIYGYQISDLNADRLPDIYESTGGVTKISVHAPATPDILESIHNGIGGLTRFEYSYSTLEYTSLGSHPANPELPFPKLILKRIKTIDQLLGKIDKKGELSDLNHDRHISGYRDTTYSYSGGLFDPVLREFRGFGTATSHEHFLNPSLPGLREVRTVFFQDEIRQGLPSVQETYISDSSGSSPSLHKRIEYDWRIASSASTFLEDAKRGVVIPVDLFLNSLPSGIYRPYLAEERWEDTDGGTTRQSKTSFFYDDYGNRIIRQRHGNLDAVGNDRLEWSKYRLTTSGPFQFIRRTQQCSYGRSTRGQWYLMSAEQYEYDNRGNQILNDSLAFWPRDWGQYVHHPTKRTYNYVGNIERETRPDSSTIEYIYDKSLRFVNKEVNALKQVLKREFDPAWGLQTKLTGVDGVTDGSTYDEFGRKDTEDDGAGHIIRKYEYLPTNAPGSPNIVALSSPNYGVPHSVLTTKQLFDGLGRNSGLVQNWENNGTAADRRRFSYANALGLLETDSQYYIDPAEATTVGRVDNLYDGAGRLLSRKYIYPKDPPADHAVEVLYTAPGTFRRRVQQSKNVWIESESVKDLYEQEIKHTKLANGSPELVTTMKYDATGRLTERVDSNSSGTAFARWSSLYDSLGNTVLSEDPDTALSVHDYDSMNRVTRQWNGEGEETDFTYDELGRVSTRTIADKEGNRIERYYYDSGPHATGKLSRVTTPDAVYETGYDDRGRETEHRFVIRGETASTTELIDLLGRPRQLSYAGGTSITFQYNAFSGLSRSIQIDGKPMVSELQHTPDGSIARLLISDQCRLTNNYSASNRLIERTLSSDKATMLQLKFAYDLAGNLTSFSRISPKTKENYVYSYDVQNRLHVLDVSDSGGVHRFNFSFDGLGNLSHANSGDYSYQYNVQAHIPYKVGHDSIMADKAGRITKVQHDSFGWDGTNNLTSLTRDNGDEWHLGRDYKGGISSQEAPDGAIKRYFGRLSEQLDDRSYIHHVFVENERIANISSKVPRFLFRDQAHSVLAVFSSDCSIYNEMAYGAYGDIRRENVGTDDDGRRFADYEKLGPSIYLSPTRPYHPRLALFLTRDTVPHYGLGYAYSAWNPATYVDIDGMSWSRAGAEDGDDPYKEPPDPPSDPGADQGNEQDTKGAGDSSSTTDNAEHSDESQKEGERVAEYDKPAEAGSSPIDLLVGGAVLAFEALGAAVLADIGVGAAEAVGETAESGIEGTGITSGTLEAIPETGNPADIGSGPAVPSNPVTNPQAFSDPNQQPAPGTVWRGNGNPDSGQGNWFDPETGESFHPDLDHGAPIGPHIDFKSSDGDWFRVFPDGTVKPK